jgi:hypothetical protein
VWGVRMTGVTDFSCPHNGTVTNLGTPFAADNKRRFL